MPIFGAELPVRDAGFREIVLDIETTGLFHFEGHKIVDIAAVELVDGQPTGRYFASQVNPDRDIPARVTEIHGLTNDSVKDKPLFAEIAQELRSFIGAAPVIITCYTKPDQGNYTLDIAFTNAELESAGMPVIPDAQWVNVRRLSEEMYCDGVMNCPAGSLNNIAAKFNAAVEGRGSKTGHGALLDANLLTQVLPGLRAAHVEFKAQKGTGPA